MCSLLVRVKRVALTYNEKQERCCIWKENGASFIWINANGILLVCMSQSDGFHMVRAKLFTMAQTK